MVNGVIFNVFHLTDTGSNFLADPSEIFLPAVGSQKSSKPNVREDKSYVPKATRKGMGSQALSTIRRLKWILRFDVLSLRTFTSRPKT